MSFVKNYFKDRKIGFYLSFGAGAFAVIAAIVYLSVYMATKGQEIDRVFSVMNLVLMLVGGLGAIVLEQFRFKFGRILPVACYCDSLRRAVFRRHAVRGGIQLFGITR